MQASTTALGAPALWFALWAVAGAAAAATAEPGATRLAEAEFRAEGAATWQPVSLPDTWGQRGQPAGGTGHYRLRFTLPAAVQQVWALDIERLSTAHEVRLNGQLVHGSLQATPVVKRAVHTLVPLPPHLLRAGENTLDIAVGTLTTAGLSALMLGPAEAVEADFRRSQFRSVAVPQIANVAAAGVSLFMLLLWWRRRSEAAIGSFGALCLLASLRNYGYFVTGTTLPSPWSSWLYMQAALLTTLLLGAFAMAFAERRPRGFSRMLWATAVAFPLLTLLALWAGALQTARLWLYPVLLVLVVPSLVLLLRAAWHKRALMDSALVASVFGVLVAAVHDYLYQQGWLSIMDGFWLPYAVPVVAAAFSALLLERLLSSLHTVERMNATLERKVAERTRELEAANQAKTRFLAAASHDLRQPMVSIGLLVGLMDEEVGSNSPLRRLVQRLQEANMAMERLLTRLLDLSRLQSGMVRVQPEPTAVGALFDSLAALHAEHARRKGLRLRVQRSAAVVDTDPVLLEQIVGNLLGNAVRHTVSGSVLLGVRPAGPLHWRLAVWDTGPGIPPSQHGHIFGEFVRGAGPADAPSSVGGQGVGLGLSIAQRAAALLGTRVALRSQVGRGSCFSVTLPRTAAVRAPLGAERATA